MCMAGNYCDSDNDSPCPPYVSAQLQICLNFGQLFGQHWWILVDYRPETVSTYGFEEGINIGALPASGTTIKECRVPKFLKEA